MAIKAWRSLLVAAVSILAAASLSFFWACGHSGSSSGGGAANNSAGVTGRLVFTVQPSNATAGSAISPAVKVAVEDASSNTVTNSSVTITLAIGTNPGGGTLSGTPTATAVGGVAVFSNLKINAAGTSYTLTATASGLTTAASGTFNIAAGPASKLAFAVGPPKAAPTGTGISPAVQVAVQDAYGNTVTNSNATIIVAIGKNPGSGILSGTLSAPAANGVAVFSGLSINNAAAGYTLTANASGLTGTTSGSFQVYVPGQASQLAFTVEPSNAAGGTSISPAVKVAVEDGGGNLVTNSNISVTIAIGTNPGGGTLSGTLTVAAVSGIATFSTLSIDKAAAGYALAATSSGLASAASTPFNIDAFFLGKNPTFNTSGSFAVPAGVTSITVEVWGGGGHGGSDGGVSGGGGGGGGYGKETFSVTPGTVYTVTVGGGGPATLGGTGGTSSFGTLISATGGNNGGQGYLVGSTAMFGNGGTGGTSTSSGGTITSVNGGYGMPGYGSAGGTGGGGGNGGGGGVPIPSPYPIYVGGDGTVPGGGGGGGSSSGDPGGAGGSGQVTVSWQ